MNRRSIFSAAAALLFGSNTQAVHAKTSVGIRDLNPKEREWFIKEMKFHGAAELLAEHPIWEITVYDIEENKIGVGVMDLGGYRYSICFSSYAPHQDLDKQVQCLSNTMRDIAATTASERASLIGNGFRRRLTLDDRYNVLSDIDISNIANHARIRALSDDGRLA